MSLTQFSEQVSRPYKQAEFEIIFGEGVSKLVGIMVKTLFFLFYSFFSALKEDSSI